MSSRLEPPISVFKNVHIGSANVAKFDKNGEYFLSAGSDSIVYLWNVNYSDPVKDYKGTSREIFDLSIHPNMVNFAACGADRSVPIFDVASGRLIRKLSGHYHQVNCVSYNQGDPSGTIILTGSVDRKTRIWDLKSPTQSSSLSLSSSFRLPIMILEDAQDSIIAIHAIDKRIMTASIDGTIRVYDVRMGKLALFNIVYPIFDAKFTLDAHCILCSTKGGNILLLDCDGEDEMKNASSNSANSDSNDKNEINSNFILNQYGPISNEKNIKIPIELGDAEKLVLTGDDRGIITAWDIVTGKIMKRWSESNNNGIKEQKLKSYITSLHTNNKTRSILSTISNGTINLYNM